MKNKRVIFSISIILIAFICVFLLYTFLGSNTKKKYYVIGDTILYTRGLLYSANLEQNRYATIKIDDRVYNITANELGLELYYASNDITMSKKFAFGSEVEMYNYINSKKSMCFLKKYQFHIERKVNETVLDKKINMLKSIHCIPVTNSRINEKGVVSLPKAGKSLDVSQLKKDISDFLLSEACFQKSYTTTPVSPQWYPNDLKKVNTFIASYSTRFIDSNTRGNNIKIGASRLNNICLLPGEKISFLKILWDNSDGKHYGKSGAFFKGKIVMASGGGICQISSTAYVAFLKAGIIAKTRYPHQHPVGYAVLGLDAALSKGGKDLIIENTLSCPILITAHAKNGILTIKIKAYKNALGGYKYKPRAVKYSSIKAKAYLDIYKNKKLVKSQFIDESNY